MDVKKEYHTWDDICDYADSIIVKMKLTGWIPTMIIGITRGGLLPAKMISNAMNIEMASLDVSLRDSLILGPNSNQVLPELLQNKDHKLLIVDDINDSGATFEWIRNDWLSTLFRMNYYPYMPIKEWPSERIKFAALVHNEPSSQPTDFYAKLINKEADPKWVVFPWENWHQNRK